MAAHGGAEDAAAMVAPQKETCTLHEPCRPCDKREMVNLASVCRETGHIQIVKCVREKQQQEKEQRPEEGKEEGKIVVLSEESCTPDIAYTKYTVPAFLIFQVSMLGSLFLCAVAFYRRKSYLASLQRMRYDRLVGETGSRSQPNT